MPLKDKAKYNEYMREYMLRRYHKRRDQAFNLLGRRCAICGSTENLEIDHIEWQQKELQLNKMWSYKEARFLKELEKCQVLCQECHVHKSKKDVSEIKVKQWADGVYGS